MGSSKVDSDSREDTVYLRKKITVVRAVSLTIGTIVGSGIFVSPRGVLENSGNVGLSLIVWFSCGILSMFGALSYADLGTSIKKSGGHYIYLLETLGPLPAFLRLWAEFVMIRPANTAVVALTFGRYLLEPLFLPCHAPAIAVKLITSLGISLIIAINCWSVSWSATIQTVLTVIKMMAIALIVVPGMLALGAGHTENFQNAFDNSLQTLDKLPLAFFAGMFAYGGWFYLNFVTEEIVNPERTIPMTLIVSLITVTIGYLLTNIAYFTMLTPDEVLASEAVAVSFANRALKGFSFLIPILVAVSCFGSLNGGVFTSARMLFVASREGQWPSLFQMIHIRRQTPLPALLLMMPLIFLMIFMGDLYGLLNFYSFSRWFFMGLVTLGLVIHRHRHPELPRPFKVPMFIPCVFTVMCIFIVIMSLYSDPVNTGIGCAITLTGVPVYYLLVHKSRRSFSCADFITKKLQILMEVIPQEIQTY